MIRGIEMSNDWWDTGTQTAIRRQKTAPVIGENMLDQSNGDISSWTQNPNGTVTMYNYRDGRNESKVFPSVAAMNEANTSGPGMLSELTTNFIHHCHRGSSHC